MGVTSAVLLDQTDEHVADEIRELVEKPGDATISLAVACIPPVYYTG